MGSYAHYCLHKFKILPSEFAMLSIEEQAFIIASIRIKVKEEKKLNSKIKKK